MQIYGIPHCDTVKKARAVLQARGLAHQFVDFKKQPPSVSQLKTWAAALGWTLLLNRAGTTWRGLTDAERELAVDEAGALALMATKPSLIKRPVVEWNDGRVTVGLAAIEKGGV